MKLRITLPFFLVLLLTTAIRAADDFCFECHGIQEGTSEVFKADIHREKAMSCADCHGGDPTINNMDKSKLAEKGFRPRPQPQDIPLICAGCHSNIKFMETYSKTVATNQYAIYARSIHARKADGTHPNAECVDCHPAHKIRPTADTNSSVNQRNVNSTCAACHEETAKVLQASAHRNPRRATCVTCHGSHGVQEVKSAMFANEGGVCISCHRANSREARVGTQLFEIIKGLEDAGDKDVLAAAIRASHSVNVNTVRRAIEAAQAKTQPAQTRPANAP